MFSKREAEGYLEIDHRDSPGFTPAEAIAAHLPGLPLGAGTIYKTPTKNCPHCQRIIILNPDRTRARYSCQKCDSYICDNCAAVMHVTGICVPYAQLLDEHLEKVIKGNG
jgi:hypothetical protein